MDKMEHHVSGEATDADVANYRKFREAAAPPQPGAGIKIKHAPVKKEDLASDGTDERKKFVEIVANFMSEAPLKLAELQTSLTGMKKPEVAAKEKHTGPGFRAGHETTESLDAFEVDTEKSMTWAFNNDLPSTLQAKKSAE